MRTALALAWRQQRMLFEIRPDLFPAGMLTDTEAALWDLYLTDLAAAHG